VRSAILSRNNRFLFATNAGPTSSAPQLPLRPDHPYSRARRTLNELISRADRCRPSQHLTSGRLWNSRTDLLRCCGTRTIGDAFETICWAPRSAGSVVRLT
jgi:hypothetical protein